DRVRAGAIRYPWDWFAQRWVAREEVPERKKGPAPSWSLPTSEALRLRRRPRSRVLPDRGSVRRRIASTAGRRRGRAQNDLRRSRDPVHLQVVVRPGE